MDITGIIPDQSALQAEKQTQFVNQLFDNHSELSDVFSSIIKEEPELCQQILDKSESVIKCWFMMPHDYLQAVQALALLAPVYGSPADLESLGKTWLLPAVRYCLNGMERAFDFDSETASRKVAAHLLAINPDFSECESLEQTRTLLHEMFADQQLHWSLFVKR